MSKKGGSAAPPPPTPPDPYAAAGAATATNIGTSIANNYVNTPDLVGPTGSSTFRQTGSKSWYDPNTGSSYELPKYTQTNTLSPEQQHLYDQQTKEGGKLNDLAIGQTDRISSVLGTPLSLSGLPAKGSLPGAPNTVNAAPATQAQTAFGDAGQIQRSIGPTDYSADRKRVEDALYSRLDPQLAIDRNALDTKLVNEGFSRGSQAYNTEMDSSNRQATDARMAVIAAGGDEQTRLANLALQSGQFANTAQGQAYDQLAGRAQFGNAAINQNNTTNMATTAFNNSRARDQFSDLSTLAQQQDTQRERALQEQLTLRNQPINEISTLLNGGQVSMPQFAQYNTSPIATPDVMGAIYNTAALNNQNYQTGLNYQSQQNAQAQAAQNAMLGGLFGLGSAGLYGKFKYG